MCDMQYHKFKGRMLLFVLAKAFVSLLSTPVSHVPLLEPLVREGGRRKYVTAFKKHLKMTDEDSEYLEMTAL